MWMSSIDTPQPFVQADAAVTQEKTAVERSLEQIKDRIASVERNLARKSQEREDIKLALKRHHAHLVERMRNANSWYDVFERRLVRLKQEEAGYRLLNDIRLGKIIPVVAETGTVADVTFS